MRICCLIFLKRNRFPRVSYNKIFMRLTSKPLMSFSDIDTFYLRLEHTTPATHDDRTRIYVIQRERKIERRRRLERRYLISIQRPL